MDLNPCLVTGGSGFLGRHLLQSLQTAWGPQACVSSRSARRLPQGWPAERYIRADLGDREGLFVALNSIRPAVVFHAAGRTPPASAVQYMENNTKGTVQLIGTLEEIGLAARIVVVGSAAELGPVPIDELPVAEDYRGYSQDAYGRSKWLASAFALCARPPLEVIIARIFNLIGPGMSIDQAFGRIAACLALSRDIPVRLTAGDLDARRDFVDVRDAAIALIALALQGQTGRVYHVGTGRSRSIREGINGLVRRAGRPVILASDPVARYGPRDLCRQSAHHRRHRLASSILI